MTWPGCGALGELALKGKGVLSLDNDKWEEQLPETVSIRDVTVLLSETMWNVVFGLELLEMNVASMRGPPKRLVLNESPYCVSGYI